MSGNFKEKLHQYAAGTLPENQTHEIEDAIDKAEIYNEFLNETMENKIPSISTKSIINKGKRKSRRNNVLTTLLSLFILFILGNVFTAIFYSIGSPNRLERISEAIQVSKLATMPNISIGSGGTQVGFPFGLRFDYALYRPIGNDRNFIGRLHGNSNLIGSNIFTDMQSTYHFHGLMHPENIGLKDGFQDLSGFDRLHQLPEGTMAEMSLSFYDFVLMDEVFDRLRDKDIDLRWMGVYTEFNESWNMTEIGIPHDGFWLNQDLEVLETTYYGRGIFRRQIGSFSTRDIAQPFQDVAFREREFLSALEIMNQNPSIVSASLSPRFNISEMIDFFETYGILITGVIITGPRSELLALEGEDWINHAILGDVNFLNWTTSEW